MNDVFELFGIEDTPKEAPVPKRPQGAGRRSSKAPAPIAEPVVPAPAAEPVPRTPAIKPPTANPPPEPMYGIIRDCGHLSWGSDAQYEAARAAGHCCEGKGRPICWDMLRGEYVRPLPVSVRRAPNKEGGFAFPGYCCDEEGYYIGGLSNNCRFDSPDDRRCASHQKKKKQEELPIPTPVIEESNDELELEPPPVNSTPPLPKAGGTWKQRQMSSNTKRK